MTDDHLLQLAKVAQARAYAPYSRFRVGAALLAADGRVFTAANVENASYSLTICAERAACFRAIAEGAREFVAIAVVSDAVRPATACGACRQVLAELAPKARALFAGQDGTVLRTTVAELLPMAFGQRDLRS